MKKITKLSQQKNRKDRINVYLNDEFCLGLNVNLISDLDLYVGKDVDERLLQQMQEKEELNKAINKVFDYYSRRLHSKKEIVNKLYGKFANSTIAQVIIKFERLGYIDDEKFAFAWVESRKRQKGKYVLKQELKNKGIDEEIVQRVLLEETDIESEFERALELVSRKRWPEMNKVERFQKVGGFLSRKGFSYDIIKKVIRELGE